MASIDVTFCRSLLKSVQAEVKRLFPEINLRSAVGVTQPLRGFYFVEIVTEGRKTFVYEGRADNAYDAKQKAWHAFLDHNHKVLPVDELPSGEGWALTTGNTFQNVWVR